MFCFNLTRTGSSSTLGAGAGGGLLGGIGMTLDEGPDVGVGVGGRTTLGACARTSSEGDGGGG